MNQFEQVIDYLRNRTNITMFPSSKFHHYKELVPLSLPWFLIHLFFFFFGLWPCWGSITLMFQGQILTAGACGTIGIDGIVLLPASKRRNKYVNIW